MPSKNHDNTQSTLTKTGGDQSDYFNPTSTRGVYLWVPYRGIPRKIFRILRIDRYRTRCPINMLDISLWHSVYCFFSQRERFYVAAAIDPNQSLSKRFSPHYAGSASSDAGTGERLSRYVVFEPPAHLSQPIIERERRPGCSRRPRNSIQYNGPRRSALRPYHRGAGRYAGSRKIGCDWNFPFHPDIEGGIGSWDVAGDHIGRAP